MSLIMNLFRRQTQFEKALINSSILNETDQTVDLNDIKIMLQGFPKPNEDDQLVQSMTILQIFKEFIRLVPKNPLPIVKLKVIITCNVLLGDLKYGRLLVPQFLLWKGWKLESQDSIFKGKSNSKEVLIKFIHSYQGALQKISINHDILLKSKIQSGTQILFKNLTHSLTIFYKIVNMLNYIFALKDIFELAALTQTQVGVMEAFLLIWNDVIALYLYFERFILQFLDCYQQLDSKESLQVYELFRDFLLCSEKIQDFFLLNSKYQNQSHLKQPRWTKIEKKLVDDINLFFQNVRLFQTQRSKRDKNASMQNLRAVQTSEREHRRNHSQISMVKKSLPAADSAQQQYTFETEDVPIQ